MHIFLFNFPFLDDDIHLAPSYSVYVSLLVRFACICNNDFDFNDRQHGNNRKKTHQG